MGEMSSGTETSDRMTAGATEGWEGPSEEVALDQTPPLPKTATDVGEEHSRDRREPVQWP